MLTFNRHEYGEEAGSEVAVRVFKYGQLGELGSGYRILLLAIDNYRFHSSASMLNPLANLSEHYSYR